MYSEVSNYLQQFDINLYVPDYKSCYILMIVTAIVLSCIMASKKGLPILKFYVVSVLIGLLSLVTARIFFEIHHLYPGQNLTFYNLLSGNGTESTGAYIGGILSALLFLKIFNINYAPAFDAFAPSAALCLFFGRLGCLMDGCCYGKITSLPWGISFPQNSPAYLSQLHQGMIENGMDHTLPIHPTQIYEMLFGVVFFFILIFSRKLKKTPGLSIVIYFSSYAVFRFFIEFLRGDDRGIVLGLSYPQIFSIFIFISGQIIITYLLFKKKPSHEIISDY